MSNLDQGDYSWTNYTRRGCWTKKKKRRTSKKRGQIGPGMLVKSKRCHGSIRVSIGFFSPTLPPSSKGLFTHPYIDMDGFLCGIGHVEALVCAHSCLSPLPFMYFQAWSNPIAHLPKESYRGLTDNLDIRGNRPGARHPSPKSCLHLAIVGRDLPSSRH